MPVLPCKHCCSTRASKVEAGIPRDPAKPYNPSPVAGGRRGEGEVSTHDLQYATVAAIHGNRRKRHTTDWREGRARLWFAGVAGLTPWSIGTMALQVVMSEAAAVSEVQQQSTAAGPFFGDTQGLPVLLSPAQRPLATASLVVRDEDAAGSNPVTPTSGNVLSGPPRDRQKGTLREQMRNRARQSTSTWDCAARILFRGIRGGVRVGSKGEGRI